jgi:hypothetical protein
MFGNVATASKYGTNIGSQQTAMLAAQDAGMNTFAVGTNYVTRDQIAMIHKGEAIVPAAYNPAAGGSGSGQTNNVTVQVNMNGSDKTTANNQDASKLGALISNVVKATIIKEQRNGGLLSGA